MTVITSTNQARVTAKKKLSSYKKVLVVVMAIEAIAAIVALIKPGFVVDKVGLEPAAAPAVCAWAGTILFANLLLAPALMGPIQRRWTNALAIIGRFLLAALLVYVCIGFLWLGAFEVIAAAILFVTFQAAILAELQTRP